MSKTKGNTKKNKDTKNIQNNKTTKKQDVKIINFTSLRTEGESKLNKNFKNSKEKPPKDSKKTLSIDTKSKPKNAETPKKEELKKEEKKPKLTINEDYQIESLEEDEINSDNNLDLKMEDTKLDEQTNDINDKILSVISIFFTIIIFIGLLLVIFVIYNNYFKSSTKCNVESVCKDYIRNPEIKDDDITKFIKAERSIIYNIESFDINKLTDDDYLQLALYFIWGSNLEYLKCDNDERCLTTKIEMPLSDLETKFKTYLNIKNIPVNLNDVSINNNIKIYQNDDKVILTFDEFKYQSLRHNIISINVTNNKISVLFALEKLIENTNIYTYAGYKKLELEYKNDNFYITKIETSLKD